MLTTTLTRMKDCETIAFQIALSDPGYMLDPNHVRESSSHCLMTAVMTRRRDLEGY